ncbi:MAG: GLUG motif-containing protein [Bacillota bacterium]|nr:GLUG motif-containing protein [Bacillota bacterium]
MKKRRLLGIVLSLCMALMFVPQMVFAEDITPTIPPKDTDGVYQIGTEAELYGFAELVNGGNTDQNTKAVLTADIIVNKGVLKADGNLADDTSGFTSWTPIGNSSNSYTGKFDGQGHTISGLYFNDAAKYYVGLFGSLGENGEIKNVGVIDSYFNGYWGVGGVCGKSDGGTISGCYNTGTVSGNDENVGGVCGKSYGGTISGCYNAGTVSGNADHVGGVCGSTHSGVTITGCYNTGTVSGGDSIGGVCGYNGYGGIATITGCYNTGTVSGNRFIGGVCGNNNWGSTITGCYNTGTVSGDYRIGGVCGLNDHNGSIIGCYNIGTVSSNNDNVGGVCGWNWGESSITGCFTNKDVVCGENKSTETDCAVKSDKEFADSTVCKLLDTALQNASSDVRFCQRIGKDASPLLTYQFDSIDDHTDDNPKDHICDICGERLSDHTGIDENPKDHLCDICAETLSNHTGGEATCTAKAECEYCGAEYGNLLDHNLEKIPAKDATLNEEGNIEYWKCMDCGRLFADENGEKEISLEDTVIKKLTPETDGDKDQSTKADTEDSAKTGDNTNLALWLALMLLSGAGITGVTAYTRRKRTNE